jgi:hypothetical protein
MKVIDQAAAADGSATVADGGPADGAALADGTPWTGDGLPPTADGTQADGSLLPDGFVIPDGWVPQGGIAECNGVVYACGDGIDNDGDGKIDAQDPECSGPCDNDEGSFATGIPGDNKDACKQDCFFDGNSGSGNDGCEWNLKCDPLSPGQNLKPKACPYDPSYKNCPGQQSALCKQVCLYLTPNGCDCFGCCTVFIGPGVSITVFLGSGPTCSVTTPQNCAPCTPVPDCNNPCGECELCLGKTINDLPAHCFQKPTPDGSVVTADGGAPAADGGIGPDAGPGSDATGSGGDGAPGQDSSQTADGGGALSDVGSVEDQGGSAADFGLIWFPWFCGPGEAYCLQNSDCPPGEYCVTGCCKSFLN